MDKIITFFNSTFFMALVTAIAGIVVLYLYRKKNFDFKKDAANIILLELQNAERQLKIVREKLKKDNTLSEDVYLMPTASWDKYQYLFVRDFDRDEWDTIVVFYDKCKLFDQAVISNNSYFRKNEEQIRINTHRIISDYIKQIIDFDGDGKEEEKQKIIEKARRFQQEYLDHPDLTLYNPQKPVIDAILFIENLSTSLTQTTIGSKLKEIAKKKRFPFW